MAAKVCFVVGARPNFMKSAPVYNALGEVAPELELLLVHTGQHYDAAMSDVFFRELAFPEPDVYLGVGSGSHAEQTAAALTGIEAVLMEHRPALVVVAGDVNSTLAGALAAVKLGIPVAHIESGLRSDDWTMPEEHNRKLTDHVSRILLTHSDEADENLRREGLEPRFVGNTMIDSLQDHVESARAGKPWDRFGLAARAYGLVTLHRPALVDDPETLERVVDGLEELASIAPLVFPVHPRTRLPRNPSGVITTPPLGYLDFVGLEAEAHFVLTDSGGVQEETSWLGVRCFTLRNNTERHVTERLGTNTVIGAEPSRIADIAVMLEQEKRAEEIPGWDGRAGRRAAEELARFLASEPLEATAR